MFESIFKKNNLKKQKLCLEYIKELLKDENIFIYNTSKGLIKYHEPFFEKGIINSSFLSDPLYAIRKFYQRDLHQRENDIKVGSLVETPLKMMEADEMLLNELNDDFINKYNDIITKLNQVERLQEFLTEEQKETLIKEINEKYHVNKKEAGKSK